MEDGFKLTEYLLTNFSTLDEQSNFGHEICTKDRYAYLIESEDHYCSYVPHPRPGDFWRNHFVSAVQYTSRSINILTVSSYFRAKTDVYIFCDSVREQRIGVIRSGSDVLETLPRHPLGGHTWGYGGSGPANTCDVIWGDISGQYEFRRNYPDGLNILFSVEGVLPQNASFAIKAEVIKSFAGEGNG